MRALAELVMKGRKQAAFVAVIAALLPLLYWVSAAVIALVTLRKGPQDGAGVLVWAFFARWSLGIQWRSDTTDCNGRSFYSCCYIKKGR
jgi:hypothetical protein